MRFQCSGAFAGTTLALLLLAPSAVHAMSISGGGFDQALGCSSVACGSTQTLEIGTDVAPVTGSIDLDTSGLTLSFDLAVGSLPLVPLGADDNGVSQVEFLSTVYHAVTLTVLDFGDTFIIGPNQTASVSGIQSQTGAGAPAPGGFAALAARVNGSCHVSGGGLSCGLSFGQSSFSFEVGSPAEPRFFQHTANVVAVPEPTTLALMGAALLAFAAAGRRP